MLNGVNRRTILRGENVKINKINDFLYQRIKRGAKIAHSVLKSDCIAISDGFIVFNLNREDVYFSLDKTRLSSVLAEVNEECEKLKEELVEINIENNYREVGDKLYIKLQDKGFKFDFYIDKSYLKYFDNPKFLVNVANEIIRLVYVFEENRVVGVIAPVRIEKGDRGKW